MLRTAKKREQLDLQQQRSNKPFHHRDTEDSQRFTEDFSVSLCESSVVKRAVNTGRFCVKAIAQFLAA